MTDRAITIYHLDGSQQIDSATWNLLYCTSGALLRAACKGEGLPVSGTNEQRARRLIAAGHDPAAIREKYHWRNRRQVRDTG